MAKRVCMACDLKSDNFSTKELTHSALACYLCDTYREENVEHMVRPKKRNCLFPLTVRKKVGKVGR